MVNVIEVYDVSAMQGDAKALVARARARRAHVLLATPATLALACMAMMRAWIDYEYHLCVRLDRGEQKTYGERSRYDHPSCHDRRNKAVQV